MSATEILTIGSVIKHRGSYNAETVYYASNQVTICNCVFQAIGNNFSGVSPIKENSDGTIELANTATWKCIVDNVKLYNAALSTNDLDKRVTASEESSKQALEKASSAETSATNAVSAVDTLKDEYNTFKASKDEPNGLAPLDDDGLVPNENLHDNVFDVLPFAVMTEGVTSDGTLQGKDGDGVAYDTTNKRFYAYEQEDASQPPTQYYANWLTGSHYNNGSEPYTDKIYLYTTTNTLYRFDGTDLVKVGSGLGLGHTATTAFPGDEGADLQTKVETMGDDIGTINGWREEMEESAAVQQELQRADAVVNVNTLLGHASQQVPLTFAQVLTQVWACEYDVKLPGVVLTWLGADGWRSKQWVTCGKQEETDWKTESNWTDYGGERQVALTQDEYDALAAAGTLDADTYYNVLEE